MGPLGPGMPLPGADMVLLWSGVGRSGNDVCSAGPRHGQPALSMNLPGPGGLLGAGARLSGRRTSAMTSLGRVDIAFIASDSGTVIRKHKSA